MLRMGDHSGVCLSLSSSAGIAVKAAFLAAIGDAYGVSQRRACRSPATQRPHW